MGGGRRRRTCRYFYGARFIVGEDDEFLKRPNSNKVYSATAVYDAGEIFLNVVGRISFTSSI